MVTTAGITFCTTGANDDTGVAEATAVAATAGPGAAVIFCSGAFHATSVTNASATAARPPFLIPGLRMVTSHL